MAGPLLLNLVGPLVVMAGAFAAEMSHATLGEWLMIAGAFGLLPAACLASAILLARRTSYGTAGKVLTAIVLAPLLMAVSLAVAVAGCALVANRP